MFNSLSALIEQALQTDAASRQRVQAMGHKEIRLELAPLPAIGLHVDAGKLTVGSPAELTDLMVRGHLVAFVRHVINGRADGIQLEGEGELAQDLRDFLSGLDIDWEELLARAIGDIPARLLMRTLAEAARSARTLGAAVGHNTRDYLHEESDLLPQPDELDRFVREVDRLRDDAARFEQRLDRLAP